MSESPESAVYRRMLFAQEGTIRPGGVKETTVLVLTRKTNQSIMIGDDVEISILSVAGDKVRIGIAAPREVGVFRKEVYNSRGDDDAKAPAEGAGGEDG